MIKDSLPKNPDNVLMTMRTRISGLSADATCNSEKTEKHQMYKARRPKSSLKGAQASGPRPRVMTKPVVVAMTLCSSVRKSAAICVMPGVNMELASGERMAISAMMATLTIFSRWVQLCGFPWSSSPANSIRWIWTCS